MLSDSPSPSVRPAYRPPEPQWHIAQAAAGWFVPGLGHLLLGEKSRGIVIGLAILFVWLSGLLVGGISSVNRQEHPAWFAGQVMIAPSLLVDAYRSVGPKPKPHDAQTYYVPSLGRPQELGLLMSTMAGLLNLLAIVDVAYRHGSAAASRKEGDIR